MGDSFPKSGAIDAAETAVETVKTQYFTANGAEVPALQKGLNNIKTTTADGKVSVKKVMIR